jgi:hypothetical protein
VEEEEKPNVKWAPKLFKRIEARNDSSRSTQQENGTRSIRSQGCKKHAEPMCQQVQEHGTEASLEGHPSLQKEGLCQLKREREVTKMERDIFNMVTIDGPRLLVNLLGRFWFWERHLRAVLVSQQVFLP